MRDAGFNIRDRKYYVQVNNELIFKNRILTASITGVYTHPVENTRQSLSSPEFTDVCFRSKISVGTRISKVTISLMTRNRKLYSTHV